MPSRAMDHEYVVPQAEKLLFGWSPKESTTTGSVSTTASSCRTSTSLSANAEDLGYGARRSGSVISRIAQELVGQSPRSPVDDAFCVLDSFQSLLLGGCSAPTVLRRPRRETIKEEVGSECTVIYQFNRLEHVGNIGKGAFGSVTLVKCNITGQTLALKALSKGLIMKKKMEDKVTNEKMVMRQAASPFLVKLAACFNRNDNLYFLMEAAMGGDLFTVYTKNGLFGSQAHARFYTGCVTSALQHLHQQSIIYRDVKLENVVLDQRGYAKLCDFGLAKLIPKTDALSDMLQPSLTRAYSMCGTPEYMAPEIVGKDGYSFPADWWALGIFACEVITGNTPFAASSTKEILAKAKKGIERVQFPMSGQWPELIKGLLKRNPHERLPVTAGGMAAMKELAWFRKANFDWTALENGSMEAPFIPTVATPTDTTNFDSSEDGPATRVTYVDPGNGWDADFEDVVGPVVNEQGDVVIDLRDMYL